MSEHSEHDRRGWFRRWWRASLERFRAPDDYARDEVERLSTALWRLAVLNGSGLAISFAFSIGAYVTLDGTCERQWFISNTMSHAYFLMTRFAIGGSFALGGVIVPAVIGWIVRQSQIARRLPFEPGELARAWRGVLFVVSMIQMAFLGLSVGAFIAGVKWGFDVNRLQTQDNLQKVWVTSEAKCHPQPTEVAL